MDKELLISEAKKIARPCIHLVEEGKENDYLAVWGGKGIVKPPNNNYKHWMTIDCKYLPMQFGFYKEYGCVSVYTHNDESDNGIIVYDANVDLRKLETDGVKLYGVEKLSYPPVDAVFMMESESIQNWLKEKEWKAEWGYGAKFKDRDIADEYIEFYEENTPFYDESAYAVVGGWHEGFPDSEWEDYINEELFLFTIMDSEPWIEVWYKGENQFEIFERIT